MKQRGKAYIKLAAVLFLLLSGISTGYGAIPETINYQGYLTDSAAEPFEGTIPMVFSLYDGLTEGNLLWSESQNVLVHKGIYSVVLGTGMPILGSLGTLSFNMPYYLGIAVGSDPEMTPRQPLTSVAYALTADTALNVATNVVTSTMIQDGTVSSADVNFNYAGSTSKGGPANDLNCSVCVSQGELSDSAVNSAKIQNGTILFADIGGNSCTNGQVMKLSEGAWTCATDANTTYSAGTGITLDGTQIRVTTPLSLSGSSMEGGILVGENSDNYTGSSGLIGISSAATGYATRGVYGRSDSTIFGIGVLGYATYGVYGTSDSSGGIGVIGEAYGTGKTTGVWGSAHSAEGYGGYFYNSDTGVALKAAGSGIVQSAAKSHLWISGNGVRKFHEADTTIIDMDTAGGAVIKRGANAGNKNVMLPITITSPLYGQNVKITGVEIYWKGDTIVEGINAVLLRRQMRTCSPPPSTDSWCFASILHYTGLTGSCESAVNPAGCTIHYDPTTNNVLTEDSGILYMTLGLTFGGDTTRIWIGGVRLTLEHQ